MMRCLLLVLLALQASAAAPDPRWADWQYLLGSWVSLDANGVPGKPADGGSSFALDLQGAVIVRKSHASYPATKDRPAMEHDDLMTIFRRGESVRAAYFDNEGHEINYSCAFDPATKTWTLLSDASAGAPRYRLVYTAAAERELKLKFEIAPPNQPDAFRTYVEAVLRRTS